MPCAECDKLQVGYREATRAYTRAVGHLTGAKGTPDFKTALENSTVAQSKQRGARSENTPLNGTVSDKRLANATFRHHLRYIDGSGDFVALVFYWEDAAEAFLERTTKVVVHRPSIF